VIHQGEERQLVWQACSEYFAAIVAVTIVSMTGKDSRAQTYSPCSPIWRLSTISRKRTHVTK